MVAYRDRGQFIGELGLLTEQYALRRYTEELDRKRRELAGEI